MESALDQKLDLSALHLGTISLGKLLGALLTLVICLIAVRLVTALLRRVLDKTHIDARVRKYLVQSVRLVLWVVTVLITADQLGIPVTSLVALLSVLSLAVSLAVQNVLANVAGGLVLLVTKPFAVGDYVDTPCGAGTVKDLTLTYTYLDTPDGLRIAAPNSSISAGKLMGSRGGLIRNLILGVVGSAVGNWLAGTIGIAATGSVGAILIGVGGACVVILIARWLFH